MKITKNTIYNILFFILLALVIYPNTRAWFMRQLAFSPSVESVDDRVAVANYDWKLKGLTTQDLNFETAKGKVVFVNFWATWCPPCRAEMPMIQELYNDYKDKIEFVFVTNESKEIVEKFYLKHNYDLPTYTMLTKEPPQFTTNSIPTSYLLDKKGNIVISKTGAADWNSKKVRTLLDELIKQ